MFFFKHNFLKGAITAFDYLMIILILYQNACVKFTSIHNIMSIYVSNYQVMMTRAFITTHTNTHTVAHRVISDCVALSLQNNFNCRNSPWRYYLYGTSDSRVKIACETWRDSKRSYKGEVLGNHRNGDVPPS